MFFYALGADSVAYFTLGMIINHKRQPGASILRHFEFFIVGTLQCLLKLKKQFIISSSSFSASIWAATRSQSSGRTKSLKNSHDCLRFQDRTGYDKTQHLLRDNLTQEYLKPAGAQRIDYAQKPHALQKAYTFDKSCILFDADLHRTYK
ncbi:MAG: hypothetical protein D3924_14595 [Candidatus Electrothrix sp. AR4]|nr:hypothetical protein [Candidatus Electrothrix sp. AR4]